MPDDEARAEVFLSHTLTVPVCIPARYHVIRTSQSAQIDIRLQRGMTASRLRSVLMRQATALRAAGRRIAAALALVAVAASCSFGPSIRPPLVTLGDAPAGSGAVESTPAPLGPGGPGQDAGPITWGECPAGTDTAGPQGRHLTVLCGTLDVPVSYADPDAGTLRLRVSQARAADTDEETSVLVVLPSDLGTSSFRDIASLARSLPEELLQTYRIVTFDVRGTGDSFPVHCVQPGTATAMLGMAVDPTSQVGADQLNAIARQLTFDCGDTIGPPLTQLNSTNSADDIDAIRSALGVSAVHVLASGDAATIGATYVHRYPGRVSGAVLDSPADPLESLSGRAIRSAEAAERLLDDFAASCRADRTSCPLGDDPRATIEQVTQEYAARFLSADDWSMTGGSVLMTLLEVLPDREAWPSLASAIAAFADGDAEPLAHLLESALGGGSMDALLSARILYMCNDSAERLDEESLSAAVAQARESAPLFGPFRVALAGWCSAWPAPDNTLESLTGSGAPPVIVIGSVTSPAHPYADAQAVAQQLSSATLLSWQSGQIGAYTASGCIADVVTPYLLSGSVPSRGVLCPG